MKQFKQKLMLLLSISSLLGTSLLNVTASNKNYQINDSKINGFHITVKSSNRNLVNSIKIWNSDSQYLYNNVNAMPLTITFDSYDQIISNDWTTHAINSENKNIVNCEGYSKLKKLITDNRNNFKNAQGFITTDSIFGHTFNEKTNNLILQYNQVIAESINTGLFATIYKASNIKTLMEVPYNFQPSIKFQSSDFENRAKIFPIGPFVKTKDSFSNEIFIFYTHNCFNKSGLEISNDQGEKKFVKTNINKTFDYAILNQDDRNVSSTYNIKWINNDDTLLKKATVTINSSVPNVEIINKKEKDKSSLIHQYFINNKENSNFQITVFSQIKASATIIPNIVQDRWTYQRVDDNLQPIFTDKPKVFFTNLSLKPYQSEDHTIYLLQRMIKNKIDSSSSQYLNIYNINPLTTNFSGLINFVDSQLGINFHQYLQETTNIISAINSLDPGQLRYWLLFYEHDLIKHLYVNLKYNNKNNNPFALLEIKLTLTTLVNNWNIIIIGGVILLFIITIPMIIAIIKRRKIKK